MRLGIFILSLLLLPLVGLSQACNCPAEGACGACQGGMTSITLKFNGAATATVTAEDNSGVFYNSSQNPGDEFVLNGSLPNGKFQGPNVTIKINTVINTTFSASCSTSIFVGDTFGDFTVISGSSKDGGMICCSPGATESIAPVISNCPTDINAILVGSACTKPVTWVLPTATDNCTLVSFTSNHASGEQYLVGTTVVTYTATDSYGNMAACSFNVTISDTILPVISNCPTDVVVNATTNCNAVASWSAPTANDNCGVTSFTSSHVPGGVFPIGETQVTYTATDASGNTTACSFKVIVSNQALPVISNCPLDITVDADINEGIAKVTWTEPVANVACGDVSLSGTHPSGSVFQVGTTSVVYTAQSEAGSKTTCSFNVTVNFVATLVKVGKVITPDGDGFNDVWTMEGIEDFSDNHVVVVDRWGSVIYEAYGYDNTNTIWDGTNKSGVRVPTGTYFYTLEVKAFGNTDKRKGFIELIR